MFFDDSWWTDTKFLVFIWVVAALFLGVGIRGIRIKETPIMFMKVEERNAVILGWFYVVLGTIFAAAPLWVEGSDGGPILG